MEQRSAITVLRDQRSSLSSVLAAVRELEMAQRCGCVLQLYMYMKHVNDGHTKQMFMQGRMQHVNMYTLNSLQSLMFASPFV